MLGFDYTGQTYLAAFPLGKFIVDILETMEVDDDAAARFNYLLTILEEMEVSESVTTVVGGLLRIIESMTVSDDIKMSFMIVALEMVVIYERDIYPLITTVFSELVEVQDAINSVFGVFVHEVATLFDILKINGKEVFEFWERCYEKSIAVVENMYQKFRR